MFYNTSLIIFILMHIRSYHDYNHNHHSMIREHDMMLCLAELGIVTQSYKLSTKLKISSTKKLFL